MLVQRLALVPTFVIPLLMLVLLAFVLVLALVLVLVVVLVPLLVHVAEVHRRRHGLLPSVIDKVHDNFFYFDELFTMFGPLRDDVL